MLAVHPVTLHVQYWPPIQCMIATHAKYHQISMRIYPNFEGNFYKLICMLEQYIINHECEKLQDDNLLHQLSAQNEYLGRRVLAYREHFSVSAPPELTKKSKPPRVFVSLFGTALFNKDGHDGPTKLKARSKNALELIAQVN
jgi:hypothetical protein